jgi:hypothetical protein
MELCEVAKDDLDTRPTRLGREQERLLFADLQLAFVFILLNRGWSAQEIQRDCRMPEALLVEHLVKLERLRLVELLPGNKVRLLFARNIRWHAGAEAGKAFARELQKLFVEMDFSTPNSIWSSQVVNISAQALDEVLVKMQSFTLEIVKNADSDKGSSKSKDWHVILMAAQPFNPLRLGRETS